MSDTGTSVLSQLAERARAMTRDLVRIDTTAATPGEVDGLRFVAGQFAGRDDLRVVPATDESGEWTALLVLPADVTGKLLLFSGHIDTVVAADEGWEHGARSGVIDDDGWLHGRGASDMKSGLAAAISAIAQAPQGAQVALAVSRNEENGCRGTVDVIDALRREAVSVGALIVGEPTDGRIVLGHKGPYWLTVSTRGVAAHGSTPDRGVNAILKMTTLLNRATSELPLRSHEHLGTETINVGTIHGGTMRNIVPEACEAKIDIRAVYRDVEPLRQWWIDQPETASVAEDVRLESLWSRADDPWIASLPATVAPEPVAFGTEAGPLAAALNISRAVVWGPGPMERMHVRNERVHVDSIDAAATAYLRVIEQWAAWT